MILLQSLYVSLSVILHLTFSPMNFNLQITGFESDKGKAFVEVLNEKGDVLTQEIVSINNKKVNVKINIPAAGKYGVKAFHDENNNKKMDTNLVGYPTERWGTSNNARPAFRAPKLEEILVEVKNGDVVKVEVL